MLILNLSDKEWAVDESNGTLTLIAGQDPLQLDGIHAAETFAAVLLFQQEQGLDLTGLGDSVVKPPPRHLDVVHNPWNANGRR
ncbi:MAG: hypothetical protein GY903_03435 [Fuerstiella sp.]|nr:hypothetical protein [Fuerstiella sp.]